MNKPENTTHPAPANENPVQTVKMTTQKLLLTRVLPAIAFAVFIAALIIAPRYQSVELETYSNDKFSLLAPKDYQKTEEEGSVSFEETSDDDKGTRTYVEAFREVYEESMDDAQKTETLDMMESGFKESLEEASKEYNNTVDDYKSESTSFKGNAARVITATIRQDGKTAGRVKVVIGVTDNSFFVVSVNAHQSDRGVTNNIDKIIDSFELK